MTSEQTKDLIAALIRERDGYVKYGHTDRAAQVDEQLRALGEKGKAPVKRAEKMTREPATEF